MKRKKTDLYVFCFINIVGSLAAGTVIYILCRKDTYIAGFFISLLRETEEKFLAECGNFLEESVFFTCYLCDMLWAYALTFAVNLVSEGKRKITAVISICFEALMELMQKSGIMSGTFDLMDIMLECCSTLIALYILNIKRRAIK